MKDTDHEIYWLDVYDSNTKVEKLDFVHQITGWRYKYDYPGRHFLKSKLPRLHKGVKIFNERKLSHIFEKELKRIAPDVVQSFALQPAAYPILDVMKKYPKIKWILSAWGNDLYYRQQTGIDDILNIKQTLPEIDFLFTDCKRDMLVARSLGFKGKELGVFPGGGGYDLEYYAQFRVPFKNRNIILIKGYESHLGRCNKILEAVCYLKKELQNYELIVFGGNKRVEEFIKQKQLDNWENFNFFGKIPNIEVLKYMGRSLIYIGNSISDGMPNTLLEAIVMGAFPIQSNPGDATREIINPEQNGFLIDDPEDSNRIARLIKRAIELPELRQQAIAYNDKFIRPTLNRNLVVNQVVNKYKFIQDNLEN
ncbi:glycosyltransferase [Christiangramia gaetbulicola]|uniref:glycosyltransferase n=1 Tax=Christiangramia gaetbulicola TaxID=703340 RepID=UPI001FE96BFB|nr:glycosyltransferase [Christiangramia gaetbulicola]